MRRAVAQLVVGGQAGHGALLELEHVLPPEGEEGLQGEQAPDDALAPLDLAGKG